MSISLISHDLACISTLLMVPCDPIPTLSASLSSVTHLFEGSDWGSRNSTPPFISRLSKHLLLTYTQPLADFVYVRWRSAHIPGAKLAHTEM